MTTTSFSWLRRIPASLLHLNVPPLIGYSPKFPWKQVGEKLGTLFGRQDLTLNPSSWQLRSQKDLFTGLGDNLIPIYVALAGMEGSVCWALNAHDIDMLMSLLLMHTDQPQIGVEEEFKKGFYQFLSLEAINALVSSDFDKNLAPHLMHKDELPQEACLTLDVTMNIAEHVFLGRLFVCEEMQKAWRKRYSQRPPQVPVSNALEIVMHAEAGRMFFSRKELKQMNPGDFLPLDQCVLKPPGTEPRRVLLTIHDIPFFRAQLKGNSIKILEHPLHYEVAIAMDTPHSEDEIEEEEDFNLFDDDDEEDPDDTNIVMPPLPERPSRHPAEHPPQPADVTAQPQPQPQTQPQPQPQNPNPPTPTPKPMEKAPTIANVPPGKSDDIPLSVVIEVGRLQMTVQKLLSLQPGNMLELDTRPEDAVDLVVNGKCIGKGELLLVGETLGVRILEIG